LPKTRTPFKETPEQVEVAPVLLASEGRTRPSIESAEKILAAQARWRAKNKDKIRGYQKTWRTKNRDKVKLAHKKYQDAHKDRVKEWHRQSRLRQQEVIRQAKAIVAAAAEDKSASVSA
jgi:hypothetical protein